MQTVLFIGLVFPESRSTAAGSRMLQLIDFFKGKNHKIVFASAAQETIYNDDLDSLGIQKVNIELNSNSFNKFLEALNPEIVVFDRFISEEQFGWRVTEVCPNAIRILDTEDLHCLRLTRQKAFKNETAFEISHLFSEEITKREIASIYRCDLSLIISNFEYGLLLNHFNIPKEILMYLPFMLDTISRKEIQKTPSFEKRNGFMTIGNFKHEPNWQSVLNLKTHIWPKIRKQLPKSKLYIYGSYVTQKVMDLQNEKEGFIIVGRVEDASEVIEQAKVMLAPIQFGAGLKGKLIEAMQNGTPSVTTSIGAEAMHDKSLWNGFIEDDSEQFIQKSIEIYQNKKVWLQAQQNGIQIINSFYFKEKHVKSLQKKLHKIQQNLLEHRNNNFIGSLLQHHTLKSSKYLSKWIEEKNKN